MCSFQVMLRDLVRVCIMSATNAGLSSLCMVKGRPNQGMISHRRVLATSQLHSILVEKASTHPEYVQIIVITKEVLKSFAWLYIYEVHLQVFERDGPHPLYARWGVWGRQGIVLGTHYTFFADGSP